MSPAALRSLDRSPVPRESEKHFQAAVVRIARALGWLPYHTYDARRSVAGFPDLVMVRGDRLIFAELKAAHGRLTWSQRVWLTTLRAVPCIEVFQWSPADWSTITKVLA